MSFCFARAYQVFSTIEEDLGYRNIEYETLEIIQLCLSQMLKEDLLMLLIGHGLSWCDRGYCLLDNII